jgi:hypothetical protein
LNSYSVNFPSSRQNHRNLHRSILYKRRDQRRGIRGGGAYTSLLNRIITSSTVFSSSFIHIVNVVTPLSVSILDTSSSPRKKNVNYRAQAAHQAEMSSEARET